MEIKNRMYADIDPADLEWACKRFHEYIPNEFLTNQFTEADIFKIFTESTNIYEMINRFRSGCKNYIVDQKIYDNTPDKICSTCIHRNICIIMSRLEIRINKVIDILKKIIEIEKEVKK